MTPAPADRAPEPGDEDDAFGSFDAPFDAAFEAARDAAQEAAAREAAREGRDRRGSDGAPGFGRRDEDSRLRREEERLRRMEHGLAEVVEALRMQQPAGAAPPAGSPSAAPARSRLDVVKLGTVLVTLGGFVGYALSALTWTGQTRQAPADRFKVIEADLKAIQADIAVIKEQNRLSMDERRQTRDALVSVAGKLGRVSCRQITEQEASYLGIPCRRLSDGGAPWDLFPTTRPDGTASRRAPRPPAAPPAALVALLLPAAPWRVGGDAAALLAPAP